MAVVHNGNHFAGGRVDLDDQEYYNCTFDDCTIVYSATGPVKVEGCHFNRCRFGFEEAAEGTIRFLTALYQIDADTVEQTFDSIRSGAYRPE
jgi:hypothetical protein